MFEMGRKSCPPEALAMLFSVKSCFREKSNQAGTVWIYIGKIMLFNQLISVNFWISLKLFEKER